MSDPRTTAWLAELQQRFGAMLRTPLDRSTGSLRARTESYDMRLCADVLPGPRATAHERLAVYHRQYWFRLFSVLQGEYRLTAHLLGMWSFNGLAAGYLAQHPPHSFDLQHIAHDFVPYMASSFGEQLHHERVACAALLEAATIDHAFSRVFLAPELAPLDASELSSRSLPDTQLRLAPTVALLTQHWPLIELRRSLLGESDESAVALPPALSEPQYWAVFRTDTGHGVAALEPLAHRLFTLLAAHPVGVALAELETSCEPEQRSTLPKRVRALLRDSVRAQFWAA